MGTTPAAPFPLFCVSPPVYAMRSAVPRRTWCHLSMCKAPRLKDGPTCGVSNPWRPRSHRCCCAEDGRTQDPCSAATAIRGRDHLSRLPGTGAGAVCRGHRAPVTFRYRLSFSPPASPSAWSSREHIPWSGFPAHEDMAGHGLLHRYRCCVHG